MTRAKNIEDVLEKLQQALLDTPDADLFELFLAAAVGTLTLTVNSLSDADAKIRLRAALLVLAFATFDVAPRAFDKAPLESLEVPPRVM